MFAGMRPDAKEIKARIDLVEYLTSLGIELKPVGSGGEYRGVCPLPSHGDAVPSFQVNRRKGLWHCFGCGAGGDVISFVMMREGVSFQEALAILAIPVGLDEGVRTEGTERGYIFCAAADYWSKCLGGSSSARSYIERRGIGSPEITERYGIGFAPGRTRTRDWLLTKGFEVSEIEAAGLVNRRGLDSFFGRVTFPLVEDGKVVNVYGRSLSNNYRHMYLPARRDVIFNIDHVEGDSAILTESVIDTLTLVALGIENAVSTLSARLTAHQVDVIVGRFGQVVIAFDGDAAGRSGARATAAALSGRGVGVRIVELPQGSDVNSLLADGCDAGEIECLLAGDPR